jgi:TonB family protein
MAQKARSVKFVLFILAIIALILACTKQAQKSTEETGGEFVPVDQPPVLLEKVAAEYPSDAALNHITDTIWLKVYIDTLGIPRNPMVVQSSNRNVGFEEAAIAAALKEKWKPAMSKGKPVGVWVTFKIDFALK